MNYITYWTYCHWITFLPQLYVLLLIFLVMILKWNWTKIGYMQHLFRARYYQFTHCAWPLQDNTVPQLSLYKKSIGQPVSRQQKCTFNLPSIFFAPRNIYYSRVLKDFTGWLWSFSKLWPQIFDSEMDFLTDDSET